MENSINWLFKRKPERSQDSCPQADVASTSTSSKNKNALLYEFHALAKDVGRRATEYDAAGSAREAILHYAKGLEVLQEALSLPSASSPEASKAVAEMRGWRSSFKERVHTLEKWLGTTARSNSHVSAKSTSPSPAGGHAATPASGRAAAASASSSKPSSQQATTHSAAPSSTDSEYHHLIEEEILDKSLGDLHFGSMEVEADIQAQL
ncbi:hypothetical protein CYMTET_32267 [Cymbomonas tetramitiformis]|uniref:MIT domain-containing protein n=1 Tax=Cymbomonas tetramitiformis TaxID=36881 RepID=A0AAE0FF71_9CHLO|nr:hypothetical protein CYMTET_32267 [Cymbomonas tetramitiformis]